MEEPDVFEKFFDIEGYGADCAEALTTTPQVSVPELDDSLTPAGSSVSFSICCTLPYQISSLQVCGP